ncbi:MAG: PTS galactitol transporter subunit IIC [Chloroflexi bacterium]|nr:PTS galactitol transporter subunit IIC [Chloroflexota bacterium]
MGLGIPVLLPLIIIVLGLIFGQKFATALRAGLTFGAGFIALNLVIALLIDNMVPVVNNLVADTGTKLTILDVGWGVAGAISWATKASAVVLPVGLLVNFIMLAFKWTKTLDVDIWNYWNQAFTASVLYLVTGSFLWAIIGVVVHTVYALKVADHTAERVQEFYELPGISIPHGWAVTSYPIIFVVNWVLDRIPGIKDIKWDQGAIQEKLGVFGEPLILGTILGIVVGAVGGLWRDPVALITLGVTIGTAMILIPKIIGFFMEALTPLSQSAREFMSKRFADREIYIGLDSAVLVGHPVTVSAAIILIPLVLGLAFILPGNKVLPFGDLASLFYFVAFVPFMTKGNLFRSIISGLFIMSVVMYVLTSFGPALTQMAVEVGYEIPAGAVDITGLSAGNWVAWVVYQVARLFTGG